MPYGSKGVKIGYACHGASSREVAGVARGPFDLIRSLTSADCLNQLLSVEHRAVPKGAAQLAGPGLACPARMPGNLGPPGCELRE